MAVPRAQELTSKTACIGKPTEKSTTASAACLWTEVGNSGFIGTSITGVDFPRSQGLRDLILIARREHGQMCNRIHIFKPAQLRHPVLGHTISDGDRVGL